MFIEKIHNLVRDSVRKTIQRAKYDLWAKEAKLEEESGKATVITSETDIEEFIKSL